MQTAQTEPLIRTNTGSYIITDTRGREWVIEVKPDPLCPGKVYACHHDLGNSIDSADNCVSAICSFLHHHRITINSNIRQLWQWERNRI